jgi:hypothetical protein
MKQRVRLAVGLCGMVILIANAWGLFPTHRATRLFTVDGIEMNQALTVDGIHPSPYWINKVNKAWALATNASRNAVY